MGTKSSLLSPEKESSNYDEILMQHTLHFTDSLKELKNLREQLYSAAEYFELSYGKDEDKKQAVDTMKAYVGKAFISTVDHLGSVASKLDTFLDENVDDFSATKLRLSCLEQRSRSCQEFIDRNGLSQQSFATVTPMYQKHYINPAEDIVFDLDKPNKKTPKKKTIFYPRDNIHQNHQQQGYCFPSTFLATTTKQHPTLPRRRHNNPAFAEPSPNRHAFSFTRAASTKEFGKQYVFPLHFPLERSGSYSHRSTSPSAKQQFPPEPPQMAISMPLNHAKAISSQDMQLQSMKSKRVLKSLLSFQFQD